MLTLRELLPPNREADDELVLPFERRQHSRLRARLASGREAALLLPRGAVLRGGDRVGGFDEAGEPICVGVVAAPEDVYDVTGERLVRAAYHLGNRHVPLEIGADFLRLGRDPVLREMLVGLGFAVAEKVAPFEPEPGAYGHGHDSGAGSQTGEGREGPPHHHH